MKSFQEIGKEVGDLVDEKQAAYGDSFGRSGKVMAELYPNGIPPKALDDALVIVRILDKLFRIATAQGEADMMGEDPWRDIVGYGLLSLRRQMVKRAADEENISVEEVMKRYAKTLDDSNIPTPQDVDDKDLPPYYDKEDFDEDEYWKDRDKKTGKKNK